MRMDNQRQVAQAGSEPAPPVIDLRSTADGRVAVLTGRWTLRALGDRLKQVRAALSDNVGEPGLAWDLNAVEAMDSVGALLLWRAWNRALPEDCRLPDRHRRLFDYWMQQDATPAPHVAAPERFGARAVTALAAPLRTAVDRGATWLGVLGDLVLDTATIIARPARAPWRELSATMYMTGLRALPVTGLVGALIGVVVAYLLGRQLRSLGADQFIVDLLGYAVIRELGPLIGAIIVAGRSGSAMTAQIGVMRLAQELDAMSALGMSVSQRVIWPKIVALTLVMPLVVLWTILCGLAGGIAATQITLDLGLDYFLAELPDRIPVANLWIALGKAAVFGTAVGLTAAYFGLRTKPNTRDLGDKTTRAVVASITLVILIDALFAIVMQNVGF